MAAASVEWQGFTRAIKDGFDHAERVQLIEMLWEVAYADGTLHGYEASLLRRITGLLYVSDRGERGGAQARVRPPRPAITPRLDIGSISLVSAVRRS
jgi:uncharacterized tellurite resistance protein B-like protein